MCIGKFFEGLYNDLSPNQTKGNYMLKTIENNSVILIDPDQETEIVAQLLLKMNAFVSIKTVEIVTTLDKTTQYRERLAGRFPKLHPLTSQGRRKAYKLQDLIEWMENPADYRQHFETGNSPHQEIDK